MPEEIAFSRACPLKASSEMASPPAEKKWHAAQCGTNDNRHNHSVDKIGIDHQRHSAEQKVEVFHASAIGEIHQANT